MKKTGILLGIILCLTAGLSYTIFSSTKLVSTINEEGYAVSDNAGVIASLNAGDTSSKGLVLIDDSDKIYSGITGYYVDSDNTKIDSSFPLFVHNGTSLRFLNDENWLITPELDLLSTYEGLYLTDGVTYNEEQMQVDLDEFILLYVDNGIYLNAQKAAIDTQTEHIDLPVNSIIKFTEDKVLAYEYNENYLSSNKVLITVDSTIEIGNHRYTYDGFIKALGLVNDAVTMQEKGNNVDEILTQAAGIIRQNTLSAKSYIKDLSAQETDPSKVDALNVEKKDDSSMDKSNSDNKDVSKAEETTKVESNIEQESHNQKDSTNDNDKQSESKTSKKTETKDTNATVDGEDEKENDDSGKDKSGGSEGEISYTVPQVTFGNFKVWTYGVNGTLTIKDPSDAITKDVTITAYRGTREVGGETVGRSALARVALNNDGEFTLATLPPNTKVYLQLTYKYIEPTWSKVTVRVTDKDGNYVLDEKGQYVTKEELQQIGLRKTYNSPIVELTTASTSEVKPVALNYDEIFAVGNNSFKFDNIKIENTTNYNPKGTSFDNFKLNTLPYINKINYTLKASGTEDIVLSAGKSIIKKAQTQNDFGTFSATSEKATSNTKYTYEVELLDKYGNVIPCIIGDGYTGAVYTSKTHVNYTLTEIENSMKKFTFEIKIVDPDNTIIKDGSTKSSIKAKFQYKNENGDFIDETVVGTVTYKDGSKEITESLKFSDDGYIILTNPIHGRKYDITIDTLQYDYTYYLTSLVSYDINPDGFSYSDFIFYDREILPVRKLYTASLDAGEVSFDSSIPTVSDTTAIVNFTMNADTTTNILEVISKYRFSIGSTDGSAILPQTVELKYTDLSDKIITTGNGLYQYNNGYVRIKDAVEATYDVKGKLVKAAEPSVYLYGNEKQLVGKSIWDAFTIHKTYDPETDTFSSEKPATIVFELPQNSLSTKTNYTVNAQAIVDKGTREYQVYTKLSATTFKTRKISPKISDYTFFAASSIAELQNFGVYDVDGTILDYEGNVNFKLYYTDLNGNSKLVKISSIKPSKDINTYNKNTITFDNLVINGDYRIDIEASVYNDTDYSTGKKTDVLLKSISFKAGEKLYADLKLESNELSSTTNKYNAIFTLNGLDKDKFLEEDPKLYLYLYKSESIKQADYDETNNLLSDDKAYVAMSLNDNDEYVIENKKIELELDADSSYEMIVKCIYNNKPFTLSRYEFNTGNEYVLVKNNDELVAAIKADNYANILVTEDFEHNKACDVTFHGTIDFDGHTITRASNYKSYMINSLAADGVIKNLHYVIPDKYTIPNTNTSNTIYSTITVNNYGTIEDLVFRFAGETNIYSSNSGNDFNIAFVTYNNQGTIRNFAVAIEGNINFTRQRDCGKAYFSIVSRSLTYQGRIENGTIYSLNGAGVAFRNESTTAEIVGALINSYGYYEKTIISHVYVTTDVWFSSQTYDSNMDYCSTLFKGNNISLGSPLYYVGDYYLLNESSKLSYVNPIYSERIAYVNNQKLDHPIWHITQSDSYSNSLKIDVKYANIMQLYDADWQKSILGDDFIIDEAIQRGYYPRVKLSDSMMKYLDYVSLPVLGIDTTPSLISDEFLYDENHSVGNDNADILFRFKNDRNAKITEMNIEGLDITNLTCLGKQDDGLYDVVVHAKVSQDSNINYVNEYKVSSFSYANGSKNVIVNTNYKTKNISFYKEIKTVQDWVDINGGYKFTDQYSNEITVPSSKTLKWNYRIVNDIDFTMPLANGSIATAKQININGSTTNLNATSSFTGTIDGGVYDKYGNLVSMHTLSNIDLSDVTPTSQSFGLISYFYGATLKNVIFDNFKLILNNGSTSSNVGLLGNCSTTTANNHPSVVNNVHVINSEVVGQGNCGVIAGNFSTSMMYDCSVSNTKLSDTVNDINSYYGGLVGNLANRQALLTNSYVRDIDIDIFNSSKSQAVGGVVGYESYYISNLYATGTIDTSSDNVGGISGLGYTSELFAINRGCFSNVTIDTSGSFAYGLGGGVQKNKRIYASSIAFGNIISSGVGNRTIPDEAKNNNTTQFNGTYAYLGQNVNSMDKNDPGSAIELLNGNDLLKRSTWADKIQIGDSYDLSTISSKYLPVLNKFNNSNERVYGQTENLIDMPGQGGEHVLNIYDTSYNVSSNSYIVSAVVEHPKITHQEFKNMLELGYEWLSISVDGMNLNISSDPALSDIVLSTYHEDDDPAGLDLNKKEKTFLIITCPKDQLLLKVPSYRLVVEYKVDRNAGTGMAPNYKSYKLQAMFDFGDEQPVWEVSNIGEWNELMSNENHRNGNEIVVVTGKIDFGGNDTPYRNINVYSLTGKGKDAGFYNLSYNAFSDGVGSPWFENIGAGLNNLVFENISVDYTGSLIKKSELSLFKSLYGIYNSTFNNIDIKTDYNSAEKTSLINTIKFNPIQNVTVDGLDYEYTGTTNLNLNSGVFVETFYTIDKINFKNIDISAPKGNNISIFYSDGSSGYLTSQYMDFDNVSIEANGTAHIFGSLSYGFIYNLKANNLDITSATSTVSICNTYRTYHDILVTNSNFTSNGGAAYGVTEGKIGSGQNIVLDNVKVKAKTNAALIAAYSCSSNYTLVNNCEVESTGTAAEYTSGMYGYTDTNNPTGIKNFVVRNTKVTGNKNVSAVVGYNNQTPMYIESGYIAEDVTVVGKANNVGAVLGSGKYVNIRNIVSGATVQSQKSYAGGLVGLVSNNNVQFNILGCTVAGDVSANEYAGSIIGYVDDATLRITPSENNAQMSKVLVAPSSITTNNGTASIWANSANPQLLGDAQIYAWGRTVVDGQSIENKVSQDTMMSATVPSISPSGTVVSAEDIAKVDNFKKYAVQTTSVFDFSKYTPVSEDKKTLTMYYPFLNLGAPSDYMKEKGYTYSNYQFSSTGLTSNKDAGIKLPLNTGDPDEPYVYASGVDSINIELSTNTAGKVKVNGLEYQTNTNGIITFEYNYTSDFTVQVGTGEIKTYHASDIASNSSLVSNYMYFKDKDDTSGRTINIVDVSVDGGVVEGEFATVDFVDTLDGGQSIVNIWGNTCLSSDGYTYTIDGQSVVKSATRTNPNNGIASRKVKPAIKYNVKVTDLISYDIGLYYKLSTLDKYLGSIASGSSVVNGQVYYVGGSLFTINPYMGAKPNSVAMYASENSAKPYLFTLNFDGQLHSYGTPIKYPDSFDNSNILSITSSVNKDDGTIFNYPVVLVEYEDGYVAFNFKDGTELFSTKPAPKLLSFGLNLFKGLFNGGTNTDNNPDSTNDILASYNAMFAGSPLTTTMASPNVIKLGPAISAVHDDTTDTSNEIEGEGISENDYIGDEVIDGLAEETNEIVETTSEGNAEESFFSDLPGVAMAYNPYTKQYEPFETKELEITNNPTSLQDKVNETKRIEEVEKKLEEENKSNALQIGSLISNIGGKEKTGGVFTVLIVIASVLTLSIGYILVSTRRRK